MDKAHKWTDAELKRLERSINVEYTKAYRECRKQMSDIALMLQEHPEWDANKRMIESQKYNRLDNLCNQMAETMKDASKTAERYINKSAVNVYQKNYNSIVESFGNAGIGFDVIDNTAVKNILTKEVNPFEKISFDKAQNKSYLADRLRSEMITSILKGESIPKMASRLKSVAEGNLSNAITTARTETTRIENSARQAVGDEGKNLGFKMGKRWIATKDGRTREAHMDMDRVEVLSDEPFVVDGEEMMYPGDVSLGASAANVCNCRCTVVYFIMEKNRKLNS